MQHKYDYNKHHYRYHRVFDETSSAYVLIDKRGNQYIIDKKDVKDIRTLKLLPVGSPVFHSKWGKTCIIYRIDVNNFSAPYQIEYYEKSHPLYSWVNADDVAPLNY